MPWRRRHTYTSTSCCDCLFRRRRGPALSPCVASLYYCRSSSTTSRSSHRTTTELTEQRRYDVAEALVPPVGAPRLSHRARRGHSGLPGVLHVPSTIIPCSRCHVKLQGVVRWRVHTLVSKPWFASLLASVSYTLSALLSRFTGLCAQYVPMCQLCRSRFGERLTRRRLARGGLTTA